MYVVVFPMTGREHTAFGPMVRSPGDLSAIAFPGGGRLGVQCQPGVDEDSAVKEGGHSYMDVSAYYIELREYRW